MSKKSRTIAERVKLFSKYSSLCDHGTWTLQTDRRMDGRLIVAWHHRAMDSIVL